MTADQDPIERQVFIRARPETVFKFLIEPELLARWIGRAQFATAEEGRLFRLQFTFGEGHTATGVFTEISLPERLAFSFGWEGDDTFPPGRSLVEIQLRPHADGTVLKLKHSGFPKGTGPEFTPEDRGDVGPITCPGWPRPPLTGTADSQMKITRHEAVPGTCPGCVSARLNRAGYRIVLIGATSWMAAAQPSRAALYGRGPPGWWVAS